MKKNVTTKLLLIIISILLLLNIITQMPIELLNANNLEEEIYRIVKYGYDEDCETMGMRLKNEIYILNLEYPGKRIELISSTIIPQKNVY